MRETRVRSLGRKDSLEKEMVIHSSIPAWRIPWTEEPGRLQSTGLQKTQTPLSDKTTDMYMLGRSVVFHSPSRWGGWEAKMLP